MHAGDDVLVHVHGPAAHDVAVCPDGPGHVVPEVPTADVERADGLDGRGPARAAGLVAVQAGVQDVAVAPAEEIEGAAVDGGGVVVELGCRHVGRRLVVHVEGRAASGQGSVALELAKKRVG